MSYKTRGAHGTRCRRASTMAFNVEPSGCGSGIAHSSPASHSSGTVLRCPFSDTMTRINAGSSEYLKIVELYSLDCVPKALTAAIKLNVFEILGKTAAGSQLSCDEIVAQIGTSNPNASVSLDRILRVLASYSILTSSLVTGIHGKSVRKYGLTPLSELLIEKGEGSVAPTVVMSQEKVSAETWHHLHETVLDAVEPFTKANGKNFFRHCQDDMRFGSLFNLAMISQSKVFAQSLLDKFEGFHGLTSLVDVGGGLGSCLSMIVSRHPQIRGINFDQPHVVIAAPAYPGIQHVGGDMFESVPSADAIFMKWILHDWSDERCVKLLRNCYQALPEKGKVIAVDAVVSAAVETGPRARVGYQLDLIMLAFSEGGKERTEEEFRDLAEAAGFAEMRVVAMVHHCSVVEFYK